MIYCYIMDPHFTNSIINLYIYSVCFSFSNQVMFLSVSPTIFSRNGTIIYRTITPSPKTNKLVILLSLIAKISRSTYPGFVRQVCLH
ncbi:hypothetical protein HanXRQr2_Chr17g0805281 [Helianthus annuus]|uniref:Uncharacterized protein n=1 Tax=Helianthus annuus TaxID=4232 RepID=A0A251RR08_HELAN|nr:hypothetical protein HanXRQr2_Chr17g0805281 [Helianthus annuus]